MIGQKLILPTRVQAEIEEIAVLYAPVLLLILLTRFHYLLVGEAWIFLSQLLLPEEIC